MGNRSTLLVEPNQYFYDVVGDAMKSRGFMASPHATEYIVNLLLSYMNTEKLFDETNESGRKTRSTLAELYLRAMNSEPNVRIDLLKKLGDTSLYISGFFAESLTRKIVNVDYYVNMGETAFDSLAKSVEEEAFCHLYQDFSRKFVKYMDILAHIAQQANIQSTKNLFQVFETYQKTGSDLARETLIENGFIDIDALKKSSSQ